MTIMAKAKITSFVTNDTILFQFVLVVRCWSCNMYVMLLLLLFQGGG